MSYEVLGRLQDGGSYRATSYLLELRNADATPRRVIDLNEVKSVRRAGTQVTLRLAKGRAVTVEAASLDDAGRLTECVRDGIGGHGAPFGLISRRNLLAAAVAAGIFAVLIVAGTTGVIYLVTRAGINVTKETHAALKAGTTASITPSAGQKQKLTIIQINDNAISLNLFEQPLSGTHYWAMEVQIENAGSSDSAAGFWKLRGANGLEYDRVIVNSLGKNLELFFQTITVGGKVQGYVVFQIPKDVKPKFVRYQPALFEFLYFDAPP